MNLIDKLLCVDKAKMEEKETKKIKSKKLERLVGENVEITIRELSGKRYNSLQAMLYDKNGNRDMAAVYDFNLMCCVYGIVEPDLKNEKLMEHFGASTPKDLAAALFGVESGSIASEIVKLSGLGEDAEEEVKNS